MIKNLIAAIMALELGQSQGIPLKPGHLIFPGQSLEVPQKARAVLRAPYGAGIYDVRGCTRVSPEVIQQVEDGIKVQVNFEQVLFCLQTYQVYFKFTPAKSEKTRYYLLSQGSRLQLTGTEGFVSPAAEPGTTYFGLTNGTAQINAPNGQIANFNAGQLAISGPNGVEIVVLEPAKAEFTRWDKTGLVQMHTSRVNRIFVDGVQQKRNDSNYHQVYNPHVIEIIAPDGSKLVRRF